jgi:hypothetical protein
MPIVHGGGIRPTAIGHGALAGGTTNGPVEAKAFRAAKLGPAAALLALRSAFFRHCSRAIASPSTLAASAGSIRGRQTCANSCQDRGGVVCASKFCCGGRFFPA